MALYPINVKLCGVTIMDIALTQKGGQTDTMAVKPQWCTCHTMYHCTISTENIISSASFALKKM